MLSVESLVLVVVLILEPKGFLSDLTVYGALFLRACALHFHGLSSCMTTVKPGFKITPGRCLA